MTPTSARPVVVGVDGSPASTPAIAWGAHLAAHERRPLLLLHGGARVLLDVSAGGARTNDVLAARHEEHHALVAAAARLAGEAEPGVEVRTQVATDDATAALVTASAQAEVLVVGTRRSGVLRTAPLGGTVRALLREAGCPVVVAREAPGPAPARSGVVVGVDGTELSGPALRFAARVAALWQEPLLVVHCFWPVGPTGSAPTQYGPEDEHRLVLGEQVAGLAADHPDLVVRSRVVSDFADRTLLGEAASRRLLVVGHHADESWRDVFWGSVAPAVVRQADGDVAVVPTRRAPA